MLALTMGDPGGIGPEVVLKALADPAVRALGKMVVVGDRGAFERAAQALGQRLDLPDVAPKCSRADLPDAGLMQTPDAAIDRVEFGEPTVEGGRACVAAILRAIDMAMQGDVDAIVTAPISKAAMNAAGHHFAGHTELLAHYTGAKRSVMMMAEERIRTTLVTTHLALRDVPGRLTTELVLETIRISDAALKEFFGIERPCIGVCGLNPHSGERGLFGSEEAEVIAPAIEAARADGLDCCGPVPADVAFVQALHGRYDVVVSMYHDQGNIPVKLLGFETGVNITLGLPIIRVSPDHGVAYDIAGQGEANPSSFKTAVRIAAEMASRRG